MANEDQSEYDPFDVDAQVELWRPLLNRNMFNRDLGKPTYKAFLRKPKDVLGLSVVIAGFYELKTLRGRFGEYYGTASLIAGEVQAIPLPCRRDAPNNMPNGETYDESHATICNLPFASEKPAEAERLATRLVSLSRCIP